MRFLRAAIIVIAICAISPAHLSFGQNAPSTGPTNPIQPPSDMPASTIVVNPTEAECKLGWNPSLRWTETLFADFCNKLGASK